MDEQQFWSVIDVEWGPTKRSDERITASAATVLSVLARVTRALGRRSSHERSEFCYAWGQRVLRLCDEALVKGSGAESDAYLDGAYFCVLLGRSVYELAAEGALPVPIDPTDGAVRATLTRLSRSMSER